jgi:hypothetical protein
MKVPGEDSFSVFPATTHGGQVSRVTLNFNAQKRRVIRRCFCSANIVYNLDRPHGLGFRPANFKHSGMNRCGDAGNVLHAAIRLAKTNVRRLAAGIPGEKETRPAVMVRGNHRSRGRSGDFQHAHEDVFEKNFVSRRRDLDRVIAVGVLRFILSVKIKHSRGHQNKRDYNAD